MYYWYIWPLISYIVLFLSFSHCAGNPGHCFLSDSCQLGRYSAVGRGTHRRLPHPVHLVTVILASKQNDADLISDAHKTLRPSFCGCPCKWWSGTQRMHTPSPLLNHEARQKLRIIWPSHYYACSTKGLFWPSPGFMAASYLGLLISPSSFIPHFPHKRTAHLFSYWLSLLCVLSLFLSVVYGSSLS